MLQNLQENNAIIKLITNAVRIDDMITEPSRVFSKADCKSIFAAFVLFVQQTCILTKKLITNRENLKNGMQMKGVSFRVIT